MVAPQGDIDITAQKVDITSADNTSKQTTTKYKQSGISLSISNPVINAIQTANQMKEAASNTSDGRMQALAAGTAALAGKNAYDAVSAGMAKSGANVAQQAGGVNVSLSIGSSKSSSTSTQTSNTAQSSQVTAGQNVNITATGAGEQSDITVIGSQIKAGNDASLKADDQVTLLAAQNTDTLNSKNKGSSASVGVSYGTDGLLFTAGASGSKGKANGTDTTWTETKVEAGNKASIASGTDTTLKGTQVKGKQVTVNVGTSGQGNLNVESLQDTSTYKDKQQSVGASASVGYGRWGASANVSDSNTKSNYASVNEQSGIYAGDNGFQVNVNGNTDLKGAIIASTDKAIQDNKNILTTNTLTTSNIENKAEYEGKASSFGAGVGTTKQADGMYRNAPTASAGFGKESDKASSTTVSAVSGAAVAITDNAKQQTTTGKDVATTVATLNRDVKVNAQGKAVDSQGNATAGTLKQIFDQDKVQRELNAQVQITQAFSQQAPKAVADYAISKVKELTASGNLEEAKKWDEGGIYRIALHTALGGLITGDVSGAAGAGAVASAAPLLNQLQSKVTQSLTQAGASTQAASAISQAIAQLTSAGIGASVGGASGAGTALAVDTNNRQLHWKEQDLIKKLAADKAKQTCNGNVNCINQATINWTDLLESVAEGLVDDKKYAENQQKIAAILATANITNSEGSLGGVQNYLSAVLEAQNMLSPYMGNAIIVNGKIVTADGANQTYFGATDQQRADQYANTFLGSRPDTIIPGKDGRQETLIEHLSAINGSITPVYPLEELFLGGKLTEAGVQVLARSWVSLEVKLAGETVASVSGNISAKQITESGIQATLTNADRMILGDIAKLPSTTLQGDAREIVVNNYFMRNGFTPLEGKCGSNCFDGVFVKGDKVYIVETKPLNADGTISLNSPVKSANGVVTLPRQMSDDWIRDRIGKLAESSSPTIKKTAAILDDAEKRNSIIKIVAGANGKGVTFVKLN